MYGDRYIKIKSNNINKLIHVLSKDVIEIQAKRVENNDFDWYTITIDKGIVVTNNYFTASATELAKSNNVILWDRDMLKRKMEESLN